MDNDSMEIEQESSIQSRDNLIKKSLPWVEKYRPESLDDLISQEHIVKTLEKLIDSGKMPHLLLYGPPGTGKTSTILSIARKLNGKNYKTKTLELNASDDRVISVVREKIKDFCSTRNIFDNGLKLVILDEADAMKSDAQAALRRIIEKYAKTTRFCLLCNHINKIIPAIQSRCTKFRFGPLKEKSVREKLERIAELENVTMTEDGYKAILRLGAGDMRKNLNIMQATSMSFPIVNEENVYLCTGQPSLTNMRNVTEWMFNLDFVTCYENISRLKDEKGYALQDMITNIHEVLMKSKIDDSMRIILYKSLSEIENRLAIGASDKIQLSALISAFVMVRSALDK